MSAKGYDGDIPLNYDRALGPVLFQPYAEDAARRAAALGPGDVLEIAAGSGVVTRELRDRLPTAAKLTATDISADMLAVARSKMRDGEQAIFETADACALPYAAESFDVIVCLFGYMFFPDRPKALREAFRALRPGGRYFLGVWDSESYNPFASECLAVLKSFFPADPPVWMKQPFSCAAIDPIKEGLLDAGFGDIGISVVRRRRPYDALALARGLIFGSPVIDEVSARGGVDPETVAKAYADALTGAVGASLPIQAIMFEAEKPRG
jgi:ubiquinone/menaquinone biosynthesis C-methylase UbiE